MMDTMPEPSILQTLLQLLELLLTLVHQLASLGVHWIIWIAWIAWWLLGVNAYKMRHALALGGWAPAILLIVLGALVWSRIEPMPCPYCGMPNFWWQLGYCSMLGAVALFCGWLQTVLHWTPHEINLDPPAPGHGHHGHGHQH